jgi:proteasome lid subunit RPN8/RPN11
MEVAASASSTLLDPHALISPQVYRDRNENNNVHTRSTKSTDPADRQGQSQQQPFKVIVHPQVQLLCDLHSHLCDAEIIGFLAGKYDHATKTLFIQACFPCNSLERTEDDGSTDVEMDPIAELCVREVISNYNLDVVGWYHSHPLFRPDPSTTDILNQYQYQQLFKHHSYDSEPFVGLIISTCDPELPTFESMHQWFHSIPMVSCEDLTHTKSNRVSKRKLQESGGEGPLAALGPMYVPMKIEISIAELKAIHVTSGIVTSFLQSQISESLHQKLVRITKEQLDAEAETRVDHRPPPDTVSDDDCVFVDTSHRLALPSCLCHSSSSSSAKTRTGTMRRQDLSQQQDGPEEMSAVEIIVVDDESIKMNGNGHHHPSPAPHPPSPPSAPRGERETDAPPKGEVDAEGDSENQTASALVVSMKSSKRYKVRSSTSLCTESLYKIPQPERITRSWLKKLSENSSVAPKKVPSKEKSKPKKVITKLKPSSRKQQQKEEEKDQEEEMEEQEATDTNPSSSCSNNSPTEEFPLRAKRVRKESYKKATDATPLVMPRAYNRRSDKQPSPESDPAPPPVSAPASFEVFLAPDPAAPLTSESTTTSAQYLTTPSLSPNPPSSDPVAASTTPSDLSASLQFHQLFQFQNIASSSFACSFLCSSPLLLRYVSLCTVALGYYYCSYRRRTNLGKKYRSEHKHDKIKHSLLVWIRYFGLNERDREEYLDNLITFMKYCWQGF